MFSLYLCTTTHFLSCYNNWNIFKEKVIEIFKDGDRHWYVEKIAKSCLFSQVHWKETAKEWHSLKDKNKRFFKEISEKIGQCPSAIYAISKLLNDIGSPYIDDGVIWISNILDNNQVTNHCAGFLLPCAPQKPVSSVDIWKAVK